MATAFKSSAKPRGLVENDFRCIGRSGFGDPQNSYAHSMAWFEGQLFVSTTRNAMSAPKPFHEEVRRGLQIYPVPVPDTNPWDNDFRAQIWRYTPEKNAWKMVHRAPMTPLPTGYKVPRQIGFRSMTVYQSSADSKPALYAASWSTRAGPGPIILRTVDGESFEEVSEPGLGSGLTQGIRALVPFKGRLFAASTGRAGSRDTSPDDLTVLECDDPATGKWRFACEPFFGDRNNITVYEMVVFNGHLYAGTLNPNEGFQLWKTDAEGAPPYRWRRVLHDGAFRGQFNETVMSMTEFNGSLYIGTAIQNCGNDRLHGVGPAAPEIIRVHTDDRWDLLVGEPRSTPDGVVAPMSGLGPGFDSPLAGYIWRMCVHDGWLYATTAERTVLLRYVSPDVFPSVLRQVLSPDLLEQWIQKKGGFDLWRTRDGVQWTPITDNGFGNPFNLGGRTMVSTPVGLFVGTANLFGPEVAVKRVAGWRFEPNRNGGAEVWLGSTVTSSGNGRRTSASEGRSLDRGGEREGVEAVLDEYFQGIGFRHCGFWTANVATPAQACENLVDELVAFTSEEAPLRFPTPATDSEDAAFFEMWKEGGGRARWPRPLRSERVLELDARTGATTACLLRHFVPSAVTGVVADERELMRCRRSAPGVSFKRMNLPRLKLGSGDFDVVVCVEGLGRHGSRDRLLSEAFRVLDSPGQLVASDILYRGDAAPRGGLRRATPLDGVDAYRELLERVGFEDVRIIDATAECWIRAQSRWLPFLKSKVLSGEIDDVTSASGLGFPLLSDEAELYVLIHARKP